MVAVKPVEAEDEIEARARLVPPRDEIAGSHLVDEQRLVDRLIERAVFSEDERRRAAELARRLTHAARAKSPLRINGNPVLTTCPTRIAIMADTSPMRCPLSSACHRRARLTTVTSTAPTPRATQR